MKFFALSLIALSTLASSAQAIQNPPFHREMQNFMSCTLNRHVMDLGVSLSFSRERVGSYTEASLTITNVMGREVSRFTNVQTSQDSRNRQTVYSGRNSHDSFRLMVGRKAHHDGKVEAVLENGNGYKMDLLCEYFAVLM